MTKKETPTAHWVGQYYAQCSNCNSDVPSFLFESEWKQIKTPFCPSCGARMENPEEDDDDYKDDAYDYCYECQGLGDDYIVNEDGELESYCDKCGCNPDLFDDDD